MFYMGYNAKEGFSPGAPVSLKFQFFCLDKQSVDVFWHEQHQQTKKTKKSDHVLEPSVVIGLNSQFALQIIRASVFRAHV